MTSEQLCGVGKAIGSHVRARDPASLFVNPPPSVEMREHCPNPITQHLHSQGEAHDWTLGAVVEAANFSPSLVDSAASRSSVPRSSQPVSAGLAQNLSCRRDPAVDLGSRRFRPLTVPSCQCKARSGINPPAWTRDANYLVEKWWRWTEVSHNSFTIVRIESECHPPACGRMAGKGRGSHGTLGAGCALNRSVSFGSEMLQ